MRCIFLLLSITLFLACDDGDGDTDGTTGPSSPRVAGTWSYSISNLSNADISCYETGTTLDLNQSGTTFTGSFAGGLFVCDTITVFVVEGDVLNGSVTSDSAVSFDLRTSDWHNAGTLSGNAMSGTVEVLINLGPPFGRVTLTGAFACVRR